MFRVSSNKCVVAAVLTSLALAACNQVAEVGPAPSSPTAYDSTPFPYDIRSDLQYIDLMVPHHQLAIDMARIALRKGQHGEVVGLARDIIKAQEDEINRLLVWKNEILKESPGAQGGMPSDGHDDIKGMPGMNVDLAELEASAQFDHDFVEAMIPHHQSAIDMSRAAMPNLKRQEVRDMAADIMIAQQMEIDRMRGWLKNW